MWPDSTRRDRARAIPDSALPGARRLADANGKSCTAGAIADHITFDGKPIYFPGTYEFEKQGQPRGYYPSLDDHFYFVEIARQLAVACECRAILQEEINGMSLLDRLALAFTVPTVKDDCELVWCEEKERGVSFGFTDTIVHTGYLLFCSILRYRAADQLADLHQMCGAQQAAEQYRSLANAILEHVRGVFVHIRHVPTDCDFSQTSAWEQTVNSYPRNRFQNGAYWGAPTGWVCYAVAQVDETKRIVRILAIGVKRREKLFIGGEEITL